MSSDPIELTVRETTEADLGDYFRLPRSESKARVAELAEHGDLVPVQVDEASHARLVESPGVEVAIDIEAGVVSFGTRRAAFPLEPFARYCLLNGLDELAFLLSREREIAAFEAQAGPAPWRSS